MAGLLKEKGIKRCVIEHGGAFYLKYMPGYEYADYNNTDLYFVYGYAMHEHFNDFSKKYKIKPVTVGNLIAPKYSENKSKAESVYKNKKKRRILLLPYSISRKTYAAGYQSNSFTQNLIWKNSCKIIDVLSKYQNKYDILIKIAPNDNSGKELFRQLLDYKRHSNIRIESQYTFTELIKYSDLNIINYLGGGCPMFQAYDSKADIFVYNTHELTKIAKKILPKAFFYYNDEKTFLRELDRYLDEGIFYLKDTSEFGDKFCNDKSDKSPGEIIADFLKT